MNIREQIHKALYSVADLNSQIPDVDQMAEFLFHKIEPKSIDLNLFKLQFIEHLGDSKILEKCLYPGVIDHVVKLNNLLQENKQSLLLCSWTQGNVFLQTQKALVFQRLLPKELLANPSVYASLDKVQILPLAARDLKQQGCDLLCVIDDRLANILAAHEALKDEKNCLIIHKIRPDKVVAQRLKENHQVIVECKEWSEVDRVLLDSKAKKIGLILDKDGIIFNTTNYRKLLEDSLVEFAKEL